MKAIHLGGVVVALVASHVVAYRVMAGRLQNDWEEKQAGITAAATKAGERPEEKPPSSHQLLLRGLLESGLSNEAFHAALDQLLIDWIRRDLAGAMDLFYQSWSPYRYHLRLEKSPEVSAELDKAIAGQSQEVWDWIVKGRYGSNRISASKRWVAALLEHGQRDIIVASFDTGLPAEVLHASLALCDQASAEELVRIRGLITGTPGKQWSATELTRAYAKRRVINAGGDVASIFADEQNPQLRQMLCQEWVALELEGLGPEQIAARAEALPDDQLGEAISSLDNPERIRGLVTLAGLLEQKGIWRRMGESSASKVMSELLEGAYQDHLETGDVIRHLQGIPNGKLRERAIEDLGRRLSREDFAEAHLPAIRCLPAGVERDLLLKGFLSGPDEGEPSREVALALIHDPDLEKKLREQFPQTSPEPGAGDDD